MAGVASTHTYIFTYYWYAVHSHNRFRDRGVSFVELTRKVKEYLDRAYTFKVNFDEAITKGDIEKASELLWGIFSCYMNALRVLRTGATCKKSR